MKLIFSFQFSISKNNQQGFTLIELILYIALVVIMLSTVVPFAWSVIEGGVKISTEQEVYSQARFISETIKREVRDSSEITTCNGTELTLANQAAAKNPTTFSFASGAITLTSGTTLPTATRIHSVDTNVTAFNCLDLSSANTENVQISFTISANYNSSRQEYQESLTVQFAAEARN